MESKGEEKNKNVTAEESKSDYYTKAKGDVKSSVRISPQTGVENKSAISPPTPSINVEAPVNIKDQLSRAVVQTLLFPALPTVNVLDLDTNNYLITTVTSQRRNIAITPLIFPIPLNVIVSQIDLEDYLTTSVSRKALVIKPLQFKTPPNVIVNSLDVTVREEFALKLTPPNIKETTMDTKTGVSETSAAQTISYTSTPQPEKSISIKSTTYEDFLNPFSSLLKASGVNIVVYDEMKPGIEDSLVKIGVEFALINGYEVTPQEISTKNLNSIQLIGSAGVFKVDKSLCEEKEPTLYDQVESLLTKIMGYQFSILIVPSCFYTKYMLNIGGKPHRIFADEDVLKRFSSTINPKILHTYKANKEAIQRLAFGASGLQVDVSSYDALAHHNLQFMKILDDSFKWLRLRYPDLNKPSTGEETEYHLKMKAVVIKHLIENLKVEPKSIKVEEVLPPCGIPDIHFSYQGKLIAVDVKTSIGKIPSSEVDEAYNKYQGCSDEVWVVLRPLPALLDLVDIIGRYKGYNSKLKVLLPVMGYGSKVSLLPLEDFIQKMESLQTC
ncbi:MAG: hypothetical protein OWQ54_09805 [Sulfolobaceae archaeon]|nr:hypothetical protein [Sulfolobaceae archaeon]